MDPSFEHNSAFLQAASFVNHTDKSIFLTGNAGTGKTTFLKYINENCPKKKAIVAPTGVAAMNAGGTTIHSLFWLPFGTYIADYEMAWEDQDSSIYNKKRLLGNLRFRKERRTLIQELELLIIDEVSMLRADMLDAMDAILKSVRRDARPFGGLQVLFIGDLYQLPPVVKPQEWTIMQNYYKSPFFFDAQVIQEAQPVQLELTKIYRQNDPIFISLLNNIRKNACTSEQLDLLNSYYQSDFTPTKEEPYITLCSHNVQADKINKERLNELNTKSIILDAAVNGNFSEAAYPAEASLELKEGAQVMFIKNDKGEERRYYNGKIGVVKRVSKSEVIVRLPEGGPDIEVEREKWENIQYKFDSEKDKIKEETLGTFSQFPLRLAWAVTIHKSQGLTFDRAIIDAGSSFAAGQVYVALSRVRSLKGLVLRSAIAARSIYTSQDVKNFSDLTIQESEINAILEKAQEDYLMNTLLNTFLWEKLTQRANTLRDEVQTKNIPNKDQAYLFLSSIAIATDMHREVANKFRNQLNLLIQDPANVSYPNISNRTQKAEEWFVSKMEKQVIDPLESHIKEWKIKKRTKKYIQEVNTLLSDFKRKKDQIKHTSELAGALASGERIGDLLKKVEDKNAIVIKESRIEADTSSLEKKASTKGQSQSISLALFKEGKSITEIAEARSLTEGTIQSHLISFIGVELSGTDLMDADKLNKVIETIKEHPNKNTTELKILLGNDFSYADVRIGQREAMRDGGG